jgi:hypothetical protein
MIMFLLLIITLQSVALIFLLHFHFDEDLLSANAVFRTEGILLHLAIDHTIEFICNLIYLIHRAHGNKR